MENDWKIFTTNKDLRRGNLYPYTVIGSTIPLYK